MDPIRECPPLSLEFASRENKGLIHWQYRALVAELRHNGGVVWISMCRAATPWLWECTHSLQIKAFIQHGQMCQVIL
jgi:hypothetical protein